MIHYTVHIKALKEERQIGESKINSRNQIGGLYDNRKGHSMHGAQLNNIICYQISFNSRR